VSVYNAPLRSYGDLGKEYNGLIHVYWTIVKECIGPLQGLVDLPRFEALCVVKRNHPCPLLEERRGTVPPAVRTGKMPVAMRVSISIG
jgi:hypothetical protein